VGLRIMKERAQRLGAWLEVSSGAGHGTAVRLSLPAAANPAPPSAAANQPEPLLRSA
jgi:nitrate/nitrite-specific signal transduction histidine kinase